MSRLIRYSWCFYRIMDGIYALYAYVAFYVVWQRVTERSGGPFCQEHTLTMKLEGKWDAPPGAVFSPGCFSHSTQQFPHAVLEKAPFQMLSDFIQSSSSRRWNWFCIFSFAATGFETTLNYWVKDHKTHGQCGVFLLLLPKKVGYEFFIMLLDSRFIKETLHH